MDSSKVDMINSQIDQTVVIMTENVEKIMNRGEKLEEVKLKTEEIALSSDIFRAKTLETNSFCRRYGDQIFRGLLISIPFVFFIIVIVLILVKR